MRELLRNPEVQATLWIMLLGMSLAGFIRSEVRVNLQRAEAARMASEALGG